MSKKLSYIFVLFGFLGFATLIPGAFDKAAYMYFRIVDGSTIARSMGSESLIFMV
jgi:hypothetical protein